MILKEHYKWKEYSDLPLIKLIEEYEEWISYINKEEMSFKIYQYYLRHRMISLKQKEQIVARLVDLHITHNLNEGLVI